MYRNTVMTNSSPIVVSIRLYCIFIVQLFLTIPLLYKPHRSATTISTAFILSPIIGHNNKGIHLYEKKGTKSGSSVVKNNQLVFATKEENYVIPIQNTKVYDTDTTSRISQSSNSNDKNNQGDKNNTLNIVLCVGFESFNKELYTNAARQLSKTSAYSNINLQVFSDSEIRTGGVAIGVNGMTEQDVTNPKFAKAVQNADIFIASLIFDYDDVVAVSHLLDQHVNKEGQQTRLLFECATELMTYNKVGTFSMESNEEGTAAGPPPAVKAILSRFSSGKEEDKLSAYLKLLKVGPDLLKFVPGEKVKDLRTWLEAYRYWNQGGVTNVSSMLKLLHQRFGKVHVSSSSQGVIEDTLPPLEVTPAIGLLHPLTTTLDGKAAMKSGAYTGAKYFTSPKEYLNWRESKACQDLAIKMNFTLAPLTSPRVAILLYRKHVITEQRYIHDLITIMESEGVLPIPIFINGVEAHTIVRDLLTSDSEIEGVSKGIIKRDSTYKSSDAVKIDGIVNTIGFPLVGGPAGSMEAGRNVALAEKLLSAMNIPYIVASPLLLQSIPQWKRNGVLGLQSVVLYSLPELDGAIDTVVLGGLVGDKIALVPERVRKLMHRVKGWVELRRTPKKDRKISIMLYGFPPNVGAVGTAALLDVPKSLEKLLIKLDEEGYDVGEFASDPHARGESLVAALSILCEDSVIAKGSQRMQEAVDLKIARATNGDVTVAETLANVGGGLGGAKVRAMNINIDQLEKALGKYMTKKVMRAWGKDRGPGVAANGDLVIAGLQIGNIWISVQPLLGVEGDPMRLLFERDLTPHPQYCAAYEYMRRSEDKGGLGSQAVIHLGMHGTVEWLPGQPLGNDRQSWSDELLGSLPNLYVYAANNPSESILAKRRGYGTLISYNVPPYGRAGLYLELASLRDLVNEYRTGELSQEGNNRSDLRQAIWNSCQRCGIENDVPLLVNNEEDIKLDDDLLSSMTNDSFDDWVAKLSDYLVELQDRLFSSGLHTLGSAPTDEEFKSYLKAYFGEEMISDEECSAAIMNWKRAKESEDTNIPDFWKFFQQNVSEFVATFLGLEQSHDQIDVDTNHINEAEKIVSLLAKNTEELDSVLKGLDAGYIPPAPGGDLLRDGTSVLPTGRNIHALDPYRMPSASAWLRGKAIAEETIKQHLKANDGNYPETIAVTLWGLDTIKTRGESIAIVLGLVGAEPVKEGTGRVVRYDLTPLSELKRPRIDVLASLSGIFRDSFANVVDLLDDMFERCVAADEPIDMNFVKKHAVELRNDGVERPAARLFSNPPGDYGSMVNEVVGNGDWSEEESLGEIWKGRNVFSYGRNEGNGGGVSGTARPKVLDKLLMTTERVVQEIDSVEYGLTDIQEYYANTGALKKAAENRKPIDPKTKLKKRVSISVVEAFGSQADLSKAKVPVRDVDDVLRLEYRSKLLNPKWRDAMLKQGSGGAYEVSQRMTAMVGWAATAKVDNFVFDQAAERYALDDEVAKKLQKANPEAFKNVVRRLLEASGRGMWDADEETLDKLKELYSDADDLVEQVASSYQT